MTSVNQQLKLLRCWVGVLTGLVVCLLLALGYLLATRNPHELTAERINIVEPDGQLKLVLSSRYCQHPGLLGGKPLPARERGAGLVFFNELGDECGGLLYDGNPRAASMVYSIDQLRNDQLMQLQYNQRAVAGGWRRSYGLRLWDRDDQFPLARQLAYVDSLGALRDTLAYQAGIAHLVAAHQLGTERLFVGKAPSGEAGLFVRDAQGRVRLKVFVDSLGEPRVQLLDAAGRLLTAPAVASSRPRPY